MIRHISATEAVRNCADLISRVFYGGDTFVIEESGRDLARAVTP